MAFKLTSPLSALSDPSDPKKGPKDPKNPKGKKKSKVITPSNKKKVIKKTKVITPSNKKKVKTNVDRFANFRGDPRYTPVAVRPDGTVTMMDKDGHTFGMGKPYKK